MDVYTNITTLDQLYCLSGVDDSLFLILASFENVTLQSNDIYFIHNDYSSQRNTTYFMLDDLNITTIDHQRCTKCTLTINYHLNSVSGEWMSSFTPYLQLLNTMTSYFIELRRGDKEKNTFQIEAMLKDTNMSEPLPGVLIESLKLYSVKVVKNCRYYNTDYSCIYIFRS